MGLKVSMVMYAIRQSNTDMWDLKNEIVEDMMTHWLAEKIESMKGVGQFVLLNEITIEVEEGGLEALKRYIRMAGGIHP